MMLHRRTRRRVQQNNGWNAPVGVPGGGGGVQTGGGVMADGGSGTRRVPASVVPLEMVEFATSTSPERSSHLPLL